MNYLSIIISIKIHAVGRRRAPKVPFALKPVNNTKGARGAFGAAGASTASAINLFFDQKKIVVKEGRKQESTESGGF